MNIRNIVICIVAIILSLICRIGYCTAYEFENNYTISENVWTKKDASKYSGGSYLQLYTRNASEAGYYVEYNVNVQESGAYRLTVDSTELGGNVYCEVYVSVNDGKLYNLYTNTGVGVPQGSGLDRITMEHLPGFKAGSNTIRFTVLNSRPRDSLYIAYLDCFSLEKADFGIQSVDITGDAAYNIVEEGSNVGAVFNFSEECSEAAVLKVVLKDYWGTQKSSTDYPIKAGDTNLTVDFGALKKGHYTITGEMSGEILSQSFVSVVTPLNKRIKFSDTPFGIDAAFSILAPQENIDDNLMALKMTGASWMRDRLILSDISKSASGWNFGGGYTDTVYTKASELGLKTHAMIQSMPPGLLDSDSKDNSESISQDYIGLYDFGRQMADYYDGRITTFEIFNEPDTNVGSGTGETGDKFANFVKAVAMGVYDAGTSAGVTAPGYSAVVTEPLELGIRSRMFDYVDVGAYHSHQTFSTEYATQALKINPTTNFNNLINAYGYTQKQAWLDETGISMGPSDTASLDASAQRKQASYCIMSTCEGLYKGADKIFSYLFNDKRSRFSWFSRFNEGPNRVYTAYSVMTDVLGEGECLGMIDCFDGVTGYIFKNGSKQILVLRSDNSKDINIPVTASSIEVIKADGSKLPTKYPSNGYVTIGTSSDPIFVSITGKYDETLYTARSRKVNDYKMDRKSFSDTEKIILHQTYPSEARPNAKYDGYKIGDKATVSVKVSNLNSTPKQGMVYAETFSGWEISPAEQNVSVDANATATLTFTITRTEDVINNQRTAVVFKGKFDNEYTAESVTEIVHVGEVEYRQISSIPELLTASSWKKSACSGTKTAITSEKGGISFKFDFPTSAADKWAYPYYNFSEVQDFSAADGILIRYNLSESFSDYDKLTCSVWLGEKDGGRYITPIGKVPENGENVWLIPFSEFTHRNGTEIDNILTTDNINYISIGVNSKGDVLDIPKITITDFGLYCVTEEAERYARVSSAEFCRPTEINSKYGCVKVGFSDAQIGVDLSSVKVLTDNEECETYINNNLLYAILPCGIENGEHKVFVSYSCRDTKAFYEELTVASQEFAVWRDESPSVWYTEALTNSDTEYSFEISTDGYYSLYATAGEAGGSEYADCTFKIENLYTFSLENAQSETASSDMSYYEFDAVYLPKGTYKLLVSKADNTDSKSIAVECIGLACEYEVAERVEGKNYDSITFPNKGISESGGKTYLHANSAETEDGKSYSVTYTLSVPKSGEYTFCAATAPTDSLYYSPYRFVIDDTLIINSHYAEMAGADAGSLKTYSYGDVYLEDGEHKVEVIVEHRREKGNPLSYYLWLGCIELRTKAAPGSTEYNYASFSFDNLYNQSVSPYMYWKSADSSDKLMYAEVKKQSELQSGEKALKKFTIKNTDDEAKSIYIWDKNFEPLCKSIMYKKIKNEF